MDGKGTKARIISGIALKSLFNLAVLKLTAVYFGTTGIALLAHLQNLTGIIIHLGREGVSRSLCTIIQRRQLSHPHRQSLIISGLLFSLLLQLVSLLIIVIFRKYFLQHFPLEISYLTFFLIYGMAVMLFGLCVYFSAIIFGLGRLKYYFFINTAGALLIVVALLIGIDRNGLMYYLFAYVVGQSLNFLVILPFILKFGLLKLGKASISFHSMREVSGFFLMAISVLFLARLLILWSGIMP